MKIRYIYSACVEIESKGLRILCDPWFSEGAFDGSWYHYPAIKDPLKIIRKPDIIYISHIHGDHYDPIFLKKLLKKYPKVKIIIPEFEFNYLHLKSKFDGINVNPTSYLKRKGINIDIISNEEDKTDIDSAIIVNDGQFTTLGLVDCVYNKNFYLKLKKILNKYTKKIDLMMIPHSGANSFPHTYFDLKKEKEKLKKNEFIKIRKNINRYLQWCNLFDSRINLPYAGKYLIGGKNYNYNKYTGILDPVEILKYDKKAVVLSDYGGEIDLKEDKIIGSRERKYNPKHIRKYLNIIKNKKYSYESEINIPFEKINFSILLRKSYLQAIKNSECFIDYFYNFKLYDGKKFLRFSSSFNLNKKKKPEILFNTNKKKPNTTIKIDYRLLFGLLTGLYHWDNASIGSLYESRRNPQRYIEQVMNFLIYFKL